MGSMNPSTETRGKPSDIPQDVWDAADVAVAKAMDLSVEFCREALSGVVLGPGAAAPTEVIARAILAAKAEGLPKLDNCGKYLAQDNTGQWYYINHAGTWQGCPPPFPSVEDEREACAKLAEEFAGQFPEYPEFDDQHNCAVYIASVIRKRGGE